MEVPPSLGWQTALQREKERLEMSIYCPFNGRCTNCGHPTIRPHDDSDCEQAKRTQTEHSPQPEQPAPSEVETLRGLLREMLGTSRSRGSSFHSGYCGYRVEGKAKACTCGLTAWQRRVRQAIGEE